MSKTINDFRTKTDTMRIFLALPYELLKSTTNLEQMLEYEWLRSPKQKTSHLFLYVIFGMCRIVAF